MIYCIIIIINLLLLLSQLFLLSVSLNYSMKTIVEQLAFKS